MNKLAKFLILFSLVCLPAITHAQFNLQGFVSLADELSVDLVPTYPKPNSPVFVDLRMYTEDLQSASISWVLDGKVVTEGTGLTNFRFNTGRAGTKSDLTIRIHLLNGQSFSKSITIRPAEVDLLWQADSYVPPFYRGKALFPPQGDVVISAMPELWSGSKRIPAGNLLYQWTLNDEVAINQSGYGKSSIAIRGPMLGTELDVEVLVTDPVTNLTATNFVVINPVDPSIVFYENSPLYGIIFEEATHNSLTLEQEEVSVVAVPYYLSNGDSPEYKWAMNGKHTPEVTGLSATFSKPEGITGSTLLSLRVENPNRILQFVEGGFRINYEDE